MQTTRARFDATGMVAAFDAERQARGLTWAALSREVGVAPSTIRDMARGDIIEMDGVLWVTAWLGRAVESFYRDPPPDPAAHRLHERMDVPALHAAMDERRAAEALTWRAAAELVGRRCGLPIAAQGLTRMKHGGRVDLYHTLAICDWLGRPVAAFTRNLGW